MNSPRQRTLESARRRIAEQVRALRQERHWTQGALAGELGLSQSRLSEIERGDGSFSAEQLLTLVKLFNVSLTEFAHAAPSRDSELQNALVRLGASHLQETRDALPSEELEAAQDVVRETVVDGTPRFLTALAPILVKNADRINLPRIRSRLLELGLERRLTWVVENTLVAIRKELAQSPPRSSAQRYHRAEVVLETFWNSVRELDRARLSGDLVPDVLDTTIRSRKTVDEISATSSEISRKWGIVTQLQPEDFAEALRTARAGR